MELCVAVSRSGSLVGVGRSGGRWYSIGADERSRGAICRPKARLAEMHTLAQRVARAQQLDNPLGIGLDDGDLQRQTRVVHAGGENLAVASLHQR